MIAHATRAVLLASPTTMTIGRFRFSVMALTQNVVRIAFDRRSADMA